VSYKHENITHPTALRGVVVELAHERRGEIAQRARQRLCDVMSECTHHTTHTSLQLCRSFGALKRSPTTNFHANAVTSSPSSLSSSSTASAASGVEGTMLSSSMRSQFCLRGSCTRTLTRTTRNTSTCTHQQEHVGGSERVDAVERCHDVALARVEVLQHHLHEFVVNTHTHTTLTLNTHAHNVRRDAVDHQRAVVTRLAKRAVQQLPEVLRMLSATFEKQKRRRTDLTACAQDEAMRAHCLASHCDTKCAQIACAHERSARTHTAQCDVSTRRVLQQCEHVPRQR
jgi:hypothetical protein